MGVFCSLLLLLVSSQLFAQSVRGSIIDKHTKIPVSYAKIKTAHSILYSDLEGRFIVDKLSAGDTLSITHPRYKSYHLRFNSIVSDTVVIYFEPISILLKQVNITGIRNFKLDSLRIRKEFASVFEYKQPTLADVFTTRSAYGTRNDAPNAGPNSTTSLVGINLLNIVPYFTRNKSSLSKLQQTLLRDEKANYVKAKFSKDRVVALTKLQGDSLENFMIKYFPSILEVKAMTEYDLLMYIKKCYNDFIQFEGG